MRRIILEGFQRPSALSLVTALVSPLKFTCLKRVVTLVRLQRKNKHANQKHIRLVKFGPSLLCVVNSVCCVF